MKALLLAFLLALSAFGQTVNNGGSGNGNVSSGGTNGGAYRDSTGALQATATGGAGTLCFVSANGGVPVWGSCAGSAATGWDALTSPAGNMAINTGTFTSTWTVQGNTGATNLFNIIDTTGNTGTGSLFEVHSVGTSAAKPVTFTAKGTANGVQMDNTGSLAAIGSGAIAANTVTGFTPASSKILTLSNTLTFTGTDSSSVAFGAGGTVAYTNVATLSSLTSVGTIGTGVWQGTVVGLVYGGLGADQSAIAKGGLLVGTAAATIGIKAVGTDGQVLTADAASAGGVKWAAASGSGSVTSVGQSFTGGLISVSGSPVTTSGTLALTVAGTSGGIPYFSASSTWASSAALTVHGVVIGGGAGAAPTSTAAGTSGQVLTSNGASADPTFQTVTGTGTVTTTGTMTTSAIVASNGGTVIKNPSATATLDSSGNISTPGGITTGAGGSAAGFDDLGAGTAHTATGVGFQAPTAITTPFMMTLPALPATGFMLGTGTADPSVITFVAFTGTGNVVRSASPTFTGTIVGAAYTGSGAFTNNGSYAGSAIVPVANGGTGLASGTSGGILAYTASGTLASSVALTASAIVLGGGAGAAPTPMGSLGTTTTLLHGNAAGAPTFAAVSLTADVSGVLPTANIAVALANQTSINGLGITASTGTLTITNAKTLAVSNTITLAGTDSTTMTFPSASATITQTIASGTSALGTSAIASGACASAVTTTATGTATTDAFAWEFNADPSAVTGYAPSANGMLTILVYPTTNNVNFKVCNNTASSITPGAITLNWRVAR